MSNEPLDEETQRVIDGDIAEPKREIIETLRFPNGFGFVLRWQAQDHWCDVEAFNIVSLEGDKPLFESKDDMNNHVASIDQADCYLSGYIKWDGCSELQHNQIHLCGASMVKAHCTLLKHIYQQASVHMGRGFDNLAWPWNPPGAIVRQS